MIHRLLSILFPSTCVACGYLEELLCSHCHDALKFMPHVRVIGDLKVCSPLLYKHGNVIEQLIEPFKYKHQSRVYRYFCPKMVEALRLLSFDEDAILVPVPLHSNREKDRGYNQSEILARFVGKWLGLSTGLYLKRIRDTSNQAQLKTKIERSRNIAGAFELKEAIPKDRQIILVDDIVTSGSTLLECQKVLLDAGVKSVIALTLANRENESPYPWNRCLSEHSESTDGC